jgi:hypothetical protein
VFRFIALVLSWLTAPADLPECVQYWQRALHLEDWTIELRIVPQEDLENGTLGDIEPHFETKSAVLRIRRESDSDLPTRLARADQRLTVAHEMVHLRRFADGNPKWGNENTTTAETGELLRKHRRWRELSVVEHAHD